MLALLAPVLLSAQEPKSAAEFRPEPALLAIQVGNLDAAIAWYRDNLGFVERTRKEMPEYGMKISFLEVPGFELELVENREGVSREELLRLRPKGAEVRGFAKFAFRVNDIVTFAKRLQESGVKILFTLRDSNDPGRPNRRWFIVADPDGNWVQFFSE